MKHLRALLIKLVTIEAVSLILLVPLTDATVGDALTVGLVSTLLLYVIGDLLVLPSMGNRSAVIVDAGTALVTAWLAPYYTGIASVGFWTAVLVAAGVGVVETFFHPYVQREVLPGPAPGGQGNP